MSSEKRDVLTKLEGFMQKMALGQLPATGVSQDQLTVAGTSNEEISPQIFKLVIGCIEELFGWLPLRSLLKLRRTCHRFKQLVDYDIGEYYPGFKLGYGRVVINDTYRNNLDYFRNLHPNLAKLIKRIKFNVYPLNERKISDFKGILSKIEVLEIDASQIEGDLYKSVLQFCRI